MQSLLKSGLRAMGALALVATAVSASAATSVGVSVQVSQPGVYGRVDIGQFPQPQVIVTQPVVIRPEPRHREVEPVYLWVPPGHQRNWRRHCREYGACGVPVYFVQDRWYQDHVMAPRRGHEERDDPREGPDRRYDERRDDRQGGYRDARDPSHRERNGGRGDERRDHPH